MDKRIIFVIIGVILAIVSVIIVYKLQKKDTTVVSYLIKNVKLNKANVDSTILFEDNTENATAWKWNFGDDQYSFEKAPSHVYTKPGTYRITLTVSGAFGDVRDTSKIITIGTNILDTTTLVKLPIQKPEAKLEPKPIETSAIKKVPKPAPASPKKLPSHESALPKPHINTSKPKITNSPKLVPIKESGYEKIEQ